MIALIDSLNHIYTVTKVDTELLLILLNNINHLSPNEDELLKNLTTLKYYVIKGKSTPSNLVKILNDTLHIAIENNIDFAVFTETILTYLSHGYNQQRIEEKLSTNFSNITA